MPHNLAPIWIGQFGPAAPSNYFVQENAEDDDSPTCQFAADQGVRSFDYDFVEISWGNETKDVRSFIAGHSYADAYLDRLVAKATELGVTEINAFVLGDKKTFRRPRSAKGKDFKLWYCGMFECEPWRRLAARRLLHL